jgi:hypothetical protein
MYSQNPWLPISWFALLTITLLGYFRNKDKPLIVIYLDNTHLMLEMKISKYWHHKETL